VTIGERNTVRSDALIEAIQTVLHEHAEHDWDRGIVSDYVLSLECMGADGEPYLRMFTSPHSTLWRSLGLAAAATADLKHSVTFGDTQDMDDDDLDDD
jgi:hypothetical protein